MFLTPENAKKRGAKPPAFLPELLQFLLPFYLIIFAKNFARLQKDYAGFNAVYAKYFVGKPARSCFAVKELPRGSLCEVELIALLK